MLANIMQSGEPASYICVDEQILPYRGFKSGANKRLPKKISVGLEYFTVASSNKGYKGYRVEIRAPPADGFEGKII